MDVLTKRFKKEDFKEEFITYPFYIISRPFKGFSDLKYEHRGKMYYAITIMILSCLYSMCAEKYTGFVMSGFYNENKQINAIYTIFMTLAPVLLFVVGNWCITAITDGSGKLKEIFMVYAYASFPRLLLAVIGLVVSNLVPIDEIAFASFFFNFGNIAFVFYLFIGLITIHGYSFAKSLAMIILTIGAMCIIVFVSALLLSLFGEVFIFFKTIIKEIALNI